MKNFALSEDLWEQFFHGNRLACARIISIVDNHPESVQLILDRLLPKRKNAVRVGITGPPGVGKSTITSSLAEQASRNGLHVGIIAVDPSSPFSGGAFLGDRIRMQNLSGNPNVFIRSLASRSSGGLSISTPYVADVLDAFGMDVILIETVGVGQAELDVILYCDVIMLVLQPSTGDAIQMMKAGIMETADLFIINKADLPGSDQLSDYIHFIFETNLSHTKEKTPPILKTSALQNLGIDEVFTALQDRIQNLVRSGKISDKRRNRIQNEIEKTVKQHIWEQVLKLDDLDQQIQQAAVHFEKNGASPYPFIKKMCSSLDVTLRKPLSNEFAPRREQQDKSS